MESSLFLAKIVWSLLVVIALGMMLNTKDYKKVLKDVSGGLLQSSNSLGIYMAGLFAYVSGALIVMNHNVWVMNGFVIITIIGYLCLAKGTLMLLFPVISGKIVDKINVTERFIRLYGAVVFILWAYLSYLWFMQ